MLRSLFFIVKLALLSALVIWVMENPGSIRIEWMNYILTLHVGLFLVALFIVIFVALLLYRIVSAILDMPQTIRNLRYKKNHKKALQSLASGLSAIAAGDARTARIETAKAGKYMTADEGLLLFLQAQSARLNGREDVAVKKLKQLSHHPYAGFLGVRGLLQKSLQNRDWNAATRLTHDALLENPKNPWLQKIAYKVALEKHDWADALQRLKRLERMDIMPVRSIKNDEATLLIAIAEEARGEIDGKAVSAAKANLKKALKLNPHFPPAIEQLASIYLGENRRRKAVGYVEKAWKETPHPDLVAVWDRLLPLKSRGKPIARMKWFEKLAALNSSATESGMALGKIAMEESLWGEARSHLQKVIKQCGERTPSRVYEMLATIERKEFHNEDEAQQWLAKAREAKYEWGWMCTLTHAVYENWMPVAKPFNTFNTIAWSNIRDRQSVMPVSALSLSSADDLETMNALMGVA
jgi:HemY protein